jgi:hypothetical protein
VPRIGKSNDRGEIMKMKEKKLTYKGFCTWVKNVSFEEWLKMSRDKRRAMFEFASGLIL